MLRNLGKNKILWFLVGLLSLIAALIGVFVPRIYDNLVVPKILPGVLSQDLITIVASVIMLAFTVRIRENDSTKQIIILGILGYLFYAYGIYAFERVYNMLYFVYLAVLSLSFYSIVYGVASIRQEQLPKVSLPNITRYASIGFLLTTPLLFYPLWISQIIPLIKTAERIEYYYSVYILDLCFIMPLFVIIAIMNIKKEGLGLLLAPVLLINGFTLLFSVGLGEVLKPLYGNTIDMAGMWMYLGISAIYLVLAIFHLAGLRINGET